MSAITFKPKQVIKRLLSPLSSRALDVIIKRYGLGENTDKMTLESIGGNYSITRERVRQIENFALAMIKKSDAFKKEADVFDELDKLVVSMGGVVCEEDFLMHITKDASMQNHLYFLLVLGDQFKREKEDVREVRSGFECGVSLNNFDGFLVGDLMEFYVSERVN